MDVNGKKPLVFGGNSGIGVATVNQLTELGADVIAVGRSTAKASALPESVVFMQCDVCDEEALTTLFSK